MVDLAIVNPDRSAAACAAVGARKLVFTAYEGVLDSHRWVTCFRLPGSHQISFGEPYRAGGSGVPKSEALARLTAEAHASGVEFHPYSLAGAAGVWSGSRREQPRSIQPVGRIPQFAVDNPQFMSRAHDGRSWLEWDVGEQVLGYDVGYLGMSFPEVRAHARAEFVAFARDFGADGVQIELLPVLNASETVWPLGYDEPALTAYCELHGVDPRSLAADDPDWARLRAEYVTQFFRELRADLDTLGRHVEVSVATEGIWARPDKAYMLGLDWPTWVDEGLIDALHPRFWIIDPHYPLSYPWSDTGSWQVDTARIEHEVATVREIAGDRCRIYATALAKNGHADKSPPVLTEQIVTAAQAMLSSGSDGFGIYADPKVMAEDAFWNALQRIHQGRF